MRTRSSLSSTSKRTELKIRSARAAKKYRSFVFYGPSGTGKTTISGSFPTPILLADCKDRGTDSLGNMPIESLAVTDIETWDDLETLYHDLLDNPKKYKTVVIDTVTQLQQIAIESVLEKKKKKSNKAAGDWGSMTKQEWGDVASMMKQYIVLFRDLPMNVVFLAQQRAFNVDDEADNAEQQLLPEVGARVSPSVRDALNAAVDVIGSTFIRQVVVTKEIKGKKVKKRKSQYCLRVGPNPIYTAKIRKDKDIEVPDFLIDPSYDDIMAIITGEA
jgi:phage nucleotide-binding protein